MLSTEILTSILPSKILNQSLFVFKELPSTNTFTLDLAKNPFPEGTVVVADRQTAGRGRLGRPWFSPPEANIYGSLAFSDNIHPSIVGWIPLMAGTTIAEAIENDTNVHVNLKWPNDLLVNEQKVGGILCESFNKSAGETCVVIGFGLNVNLPETIIPQDLQPFTTSLHVYTKHQIDRHRLLGSIITNLEQGWQTLLTEGSEACHPSYTARCSTLGTQIRVQFPDGKHLEGLAQSIGEQGQLQIVTTPSVTKDQSARINIQAGDIQHIRKVGDHY